MNESLAEHEMRANDFASGEQMERASMHALLALAAAIDKLADAINNHAAIEG